MLPVSAFRTFLAIDKDMRSVLELRLEMHLIPLSEFARVDVDDIRWFLFDLS